MNKNELLKWQVEMGADEAIGHEPINWLEKKPEKSPNAQTQPAEIKEKITPQPQKLTSPSAALAQAKSLAESCNTLESLKKAVHEFDGLAIKKTANNTVFSDGNPEARIMFIGEAPGANEDLEGIPFCGASGKLLDLMLSHIGLSRLKNIYISNSLFWRPPGNRRPTPEELEICKPFVEKHIQLINPKLLILVGGTAVSAILNEKTGITRIRGKFYEYSNAYTKSPIPTSVIFHPSYLLRSPSQKRPTWQDLLTLKAYIEEKKIPV